MKPIIILHGWSDHSGSFVPLADWLAHRGFNVVSIYLGDYLSMNDEVTLHDLGFAFQRALKDKNIAQTPHSFDVIVHSTGGLVAREYLRQVCQGRPDRTPVEHLLMLAPANFGSPLAKLGKSVLGRMLKGWDWDHLGETGRAILGALELASPYSFQLALDDLFAANNAIFNRDGRHQFLRQLPEGDA
jgi:pimeloyl-ACP methyl ester carboxylesterase